MIPVIPACIAIPVICIVKLSTKKTILVLAPPVLLLSMLLCFRLATELLDTKGGYLAGFVFYWLFWCILVPYMLLGRKTIVNLFRRLPAKFAGLSTVQKLILVLPLLLGYGYAFPKAIVHANVTIVALSFLIALVNATLEELLWRGAYLSIFGNNKWLGIVYPSAGFGLWHIAPLTVFPNQAPGAAISFVIVATLLGLAYGLVANKYWSIYWTCVSHTLFDLSGLGARVYF